MPVYSIQATTHPQSLVTWNIAHGYNTTVSLSGGVTLAVQYQRFGYADMICRLYFPGDTTESLPSVTVNEIVYHYDGSSYVYDHVNTNSRSGAYNSTYNVTAYLLSGNESMITGSYDQTTNYTDATLFSSSASLDDMAHIAREYFDNYEPIGQGTVTLSIKKPGQILNFTSRLLSKTISEYISGNATINMNVNSGLIVETINKHYERESGQRFWNEQIATFEASASEYVGIIFAQYTGSWPLDTRAYFGFCPSRRLYSSEGLHVSGGFACISANDTPSSMIDSAWIQDYYAAVNMNMTYTIARFKGISDFYLNRTISSSIGNALNTYFTETLDAGIYISAAALTVQGDTEVTVLNVTDENDNVIDKSSTYDNYGYMNACDTTILNVASSMAYKIKAQCSASRSISLRWTLIKVNIGTYYEKTFSATFGTSLSKVGSITLPAGDYMLTSYAAYDVNYSKYYQEIRRANGDVIISDSHYSAALYSMAINVACTVSLDSQETIKLYAKIDSSDIAISGVIRAVCIKER